MRIKKRREKVTRKRKIKGGDDEGKTKKEKSSKE